MKLSPFLLGSVLSLGFQLASARAEDPALAQLPPELQALVADWLKSVLIPSAKDGQTQALRAAQADLRKTLSESLPQLNAPVDAVSPANPPEVVPTLTRTVPDKRPASASSSQLATGGLVTSGLSTGSLNPEGSARMSDDAWRQLFQKQGARRSFLPGPFHFSQPTQNP